MRTQGVPDDLLPKEQRFPDPIGALMVANVRFEALLDSAGHFIHPALTDSLRQLLETYQETERVLLDKDGS